MSAVSHLQTGWIPKVYLHVSCLQFETHFFPQRQCFKRSWCPGLHNKDSKVGIHPIGWRVSDKPNNSLRTRIHPSIHLAAEAVVRGWGWSWDVLHLRGKETESQGKGLIGPSFQSPSQRERAWAIEETATIQMVRNSGTSVPSLRFIALCQFPHSN